MLLIPEIENWNIRSSHSVSNQKMKMGYIDIKNAKSQQQTQNRSLELLLNQQQARHLASAVWSWLKPVRFQEFLQ